MAWHGFAVPALLGAALVARRKRTAPGAALTLKCLPSLRLLRRFLPLPQGIRSRGAVKGKMHGFAALDRSPSAEKGQARGGRRGCSSLGMHLADALLHPGGELVRLLVFPLGVHLFAYLAGLWPSCGTPCGFRPGLACG